MSGKAILFVLLGVICIATFYVFNSIFTTSTRAVEKTADFTYSQNVDDIAQTGLNVALQRLSKTSPWSDLYGQSYSTNLFKGQVTYSYQHVNYKTQNCVRVTSVGSSGDMTSVSIAYVRIPLPPPAGVATRVKAAVGAATNVDILGTAIIDGRNHNAEGNSIVPGTGTYAIWSKQDVDLSRGSSDIGGTLFSSTPPPGFDPLNPTGGNDYYNGRKNYEPGVVVANQTTPFPDNPDSVFGFIPGTLKQRAMSSGQYVQNPNNLTYPLYGVTYVELPNGQSWSSCNIEGAGVLVVHNDHTSAVMEQVNNGKFRGIIIADDILRFHATAVGAVVVLSPNPPGGNCLGNGNGGILYSRAALQGADNAAAGASSGSTVGNILDWWNGSLELFNHSNFDFQISANH